MKATKEDIVMTAVRLFAERGYDAVSTSMIAEGLGLTKGALYRHFASKQEIFDSIVKKMFALDEARAEEDSVPAKKAEETPEEYRTASFENFCTFVVGQFDFWTENEFAASFRRMITLEQYKSAEKMKLYQDVIALGPVCYSEDLFKEMLENGQLNDDAQKIGARNLAVEFFAPLQLSIQMADGGEDRRMLRENLARITDAFRKRYENGVEKHE